MEDPLRNRTKAEADRMGKFFRPYYTLKSNGKMGVTIVYTGICNMLTKQVFRNPGTICTLENCTSLKYMYLSDAESRNESGTSMGSLG